MPDFISNCKKKTKFFTPLQPTLQEKHRLRTSHIFCKCLIMFWTGKYIPCKTVHHLSLSLFPRLSFVWAVQIDKAPASQDMVRCLSKTPKNLRKTSRTPSERTPKHLMSRGISVVLRQPLWLSLWFQRLGQGKHKGSGGKAGSCSHLSLVAPSACFPS